MLRKLKARLMNIFYTDICAQQCAKNMCDIHVNKMILETAQLLSTAHAEHGTWVEGMYKPTHKNHPSAIWARETGGNYAWLYEHFDSLIAEKLHRTDKVHASSRLLTALYEIPKPLYSSIGSLTPMPQCMPDEFKTEDSTVAYKKYYVAKLLEWISRDKPLKPKWTNASIPEWISLTGYIQNA